MRILVTGASGFVGKHFLTEAASSGHTAFAMDINPPPGGVPHAGFFSACLTNPDSLRETILKSQPDACMHLAGIAFVPTANTNPSGVINVNVMGTTNLLEAFRLHAPKARILVASSSQVYGHHLRQNPIKEDDPLTPDSLYGITKAAADDISRFYASQYGMPVMTARPCNHVGPGQSHHFVVPAFALQVRKIRQGQGNVIKVGNLNSRRDFTDVRDVVRAYRLLLERGTAGLAYNIASGQHIAIGRILDQLCELAGIKPLIEQDPSLYRPDNPCSTLDTSRLTATTGWAPKISFSQTLKDILEAAV